MSNKAHMAHNRCSDIIIGVGDIIKPTDPIDVKGFIIYIVIFLIAFPAFFYKFAPIFFLFYMANVDIIANILTTISHPNIFKSLYMSDPKSLIQYTSVIFINYVALISLFYIALTLSNRIPTAKKIAAASVMIILTFLIPTYVVPLFIEETEKFLQTKQMSSETKVFITYVVGILGGLLFIFLEQKIVHMII